MSGIAAFLDFRTPPTPSVIDTIRSGIDQRGHDRQGVVTIGKCTLAQAALWTTPEAEHERQPLKHASREFWLVADARIDNRVELHSQLSGRSRHPLDTDADYILAAYERWGTECAAQLRGDFAFAIWDAERNRLIAVRDHLGVRPLFYSGGGRVRTVVASTLTAVLSAAAERPAQDEQFRDEYLIFNPSPDRTPWQGVRRLVPGHVLVVDENSASVRRYWHPDLTPHPIPLSETAQTVRQLFDEAVRCRMRTRDRVLCQLSGGFDSSTVAATASRFEPGVQALTLRYPSHFEADEYKFSSGVARRFGIPLSTINAEVLPGGDAFSHAARHHEPLFRSDLPDGEAASKAAKTLGCSVVLSGTGGDQVLYGMDAGALDLLEAGRVSKAIDWACQSGRTRREAVIWLARKGVGSAADRMRLQRLLAGHRERARRQAYPGLTTVPDVPSPPFGGSNSARERMAAFTQLACMYTLENVNRIDSMTGVETRYPFFDVSLVEFILRTPESQIRIDGRFRQLHRVAFADRLPPLVLNRIGKAQFKRPFLRKMLDAFEGDRAETALHALSDWIDTGLYREALAGSLDAFDPKSGLPSGNQLWAALSLGAFRVSHLQDGT